MVHTDGAWPGHFHSAPSPAGRKELVPNVKSFVILCVPAEDKIPPLKKTSTGFILSLSLPPPLLSVSTYPTAPPPPTPHPQNPDASLSEWPFAMHSSLPCLASVSGSGPISG